MFNPGTKRMMINEEKEVRAFVRDFDFDAHCRSYEACNAALHYDSIANVQALASLLVDIGYIRKS